MKKYLVAFLTVIAAYSVVTVSHADDFVARYPIVTVSDCSFTPGKHDRCAELAQNRTTTVQTDAPVTSTTVVKGGDLVSQLIQWFTLAFGTVIAGAGTLAIVKIRAYFGIKTTEAQKSILQELAVNGVNSAASKAEEAIKANPHLDINVKSAVIADAVDYVQAHGADTIKALGLDPNSGDAVEAIKARIATAMNGPQTPTVTETGVTPAPANKS